MKKISVIEDLKIETAQELYDFLDAYTKQEREVMFFDEADSVNIKVLEKLLEDGSAVRDMSIVPDGCHISYN